LNLIFVLQKMGVLHFLCVSLSVNVVFPAWAQLNHDLLSRQDVPASNLISSIHAKQSSHSVRCRFLEHFMSNAKILGYALTSALLYLALNCRCCLTIFICQNTICSILISCWTTLLPFCYNFVPSWSYDHQFV
jgi:hypothetical protein